jgi:hypothetical protein
MVAAGTHLGEGAAGWARLAGVVVTPARDAASRRHPACVRGASAHLRECFLRRCCLTFRIVPPTGDNPVRSYGARVTASGTDMPRGPRQDGITRRSSRRPRYWVNGRTLAACQKRCHDRSRVQRPREDALQAAGKRMPPQCLTLDANRVRLRGTMDHRISRGSRAASSAPQHMEFRTTVSFLICDVLGAGGSTPPTWTPQGLRSVHPRDSADSSPPDEPPRPSARPALPHFQVPEGPSPPLPVDHELTAST